MFNFNNFNPHQQKKPINRIRSKIVVQDGLNPNGFFETDKETFGSAQEGYVTNITNSLPRFECGDLILSAEDVGKPCSWCNMQLCQSQCSHKCSRCLNTFCPSCTSIWKEKEYCRGCRRIIIFQDGFLGLGKALHEFLSREF